MVVKERICGTCGAKVVKRDKTIEVSAPLGEPLCDDCHAILRGEDRPELWTRVSE